MTDKIEIDVSGLPEGYIVLDTIVLLKVLDAEGDVVFREHFGTNLNIMERLGMTTSAVSTVEERIARGTRPE